MNKSEKEIEKIFDRHFAKINKKIENILNIMDRISNIMDRMVCTKKINISNITRPKSSVINIIEPISSTSNKSASLSIEEDIPYFKLF